MSRLSYFTSQLILKTKSPINGELKITEIFGKRILYANEDEQSGGTITGMWGKAIKKITNYLPRRQAGQLPVANCLILGLGGGTVIDILKKYYPKASMTVIEIDPVMIEIARKYFGMDKISNLNIINADAFSWIREKKKEKFDLIIYDVYIGKFNPHKANTRDFLTKLKGFLNTEGIILFNRHFQKDQSEYEKFLKNCRKVFPVTKLILSYPFSRILYLGN